MPVFILGLTGMIVYGSILGIHHGVQQLAAEAARATIPGMSDDERQTIAQEYIDQNSSRYAFLSQEKISIEKITTDKNTNSYAVTLNYDMSGSFFYRFSGLIPISDPKIKRSSSIIRGGY